MLIAGGEYRTALHAALYKENVELVKLLLDKGADVNARGASVVIPRIFSSPDCRWRVWDSPPECLGPEKSGNHHTASRKESRRECSRCECCDPEDL
jgi:ankyrin repeat protein